MFYLDVPRVLRLFLIPKPQRPQQEKSISVQLFMAYLVSTFTEVTLFGSCFDTVLSAM